MLCYDGQLRNSPVATHFILLSSTATSSAAGGYVVFPERPSRNEEPTSRNEEQTRNVPSSHIVLPQNLFNELAYILPVLDHEILSYSVHSFYFNGNWLKNYFKNIFQFRKTFDLLFYSYLFIVGAGINASMCISDGSGPYFFYRKMQMTRPVRKKMEGKVFISRQSRHFVFVDNIFKVLFATLSPDLVCKKLCFPPRKKYK